MPDGIIKCDTERGKVFGLTTDKFEGDTYWWKEGGAVFVSFIAVKEQGRGFFRELVKAILKEGYAITVPTPSVRMREILVKNKFARSVDADGYELFTLKPQHNL